MANPRAFHNSVVLPDGKVVVFGGQNFPVPFSDNTAVLSAELWDPATESFSALTPTTVTGGYRITVPADRGVALPGYWMLFAMDDKGVPSMARTIRIG